MKRDGDVMTIGLLRLSVASALASIIMAMAALPEDPPAFSSVLWAGSVACFGGALWSLRDRRLAWRTFFAVLSTSFFPSLYSLCFCHPRIDVQVTCANLSRVSAKISRSLAEGTAYRSSHRPRG